MFQIVIIAGGLGTRLGSLTKKTPKSLVKIENKPFIHYQLKKLSQAGFKNIVICLGHLGYQIKNYVKCGRKYSLNINYSFERNKLYGTAGCIRKAVPLLEDNFFIIYGDSYLDINFKNLELEFKKKSCDALIAIFKNNNCYDKSNIILKNKKLYYKKNSTSKKMNYIDYGTSIFNKKIFVDSKYKNLSDLSDLYCILSKKKKLKYAVVKKRFYEIGSYEGLQETKNYLRNIKL